MSPLLALLPLIILYVVFRAVMHYRAGRKQWCIQFCIIAGFLTCILGYELWLRL